MAARESLASELDRPDAEPAGAAVGASQTVRAQLRLRELIVGGELQPGSRIAELAMVERLGMSRTPIRMALVRLQEEGLLEALPSGGFMVRDFTEADIRDAIELRGTLEGLAARLAAERGASPGQLGAMRECLLGIDALLASPVLDGEAFSGYVAHNARFHALLAQMADSELIARHIERACTLPFASPNGFVIAHEQPGKTRDRLLVAHAQHHAVAEAIAAGQGARAEALMQEHARNAHHNLTEVLASQHALQRLPGAGLIRRDALRR